MQVEREIPDREEPDEVEEGHPPPDDGGFARLELPGTEPSER